MKRSPGDPSDCMAFAVTQAEEKKKSRIFIIGELGKNETIPIYGNSWMIG
ncbi:hypothetical protein [Paraburkholderia sacchari]|uniref:Uncharacterized protein n=1 Tax=Paraburkholderia sacchari TaxID=159450 RepID=A0A8T6ZIR2_9BURK|nr:hypothetical protein [Paraburkholderia sacchari]NLP65097.1 hypothetical protein [Paraburkholderia sacchari]